MEIPLPWGMKKLARPLGRMPELLPAHVRVVDDFAGLTCIKNADINLAILPRSIPPAIEQWLKELPFKQFPNGRVLLEGFNERATLQELIACNLRKPYPAADLMLDDISAIIARFRQLSNYSALQVRLDAVDHYGCKKFHTDAVGLRLLSTYHGAGTEWLPETAVDRKALGCCEAHDICTDISAIQRMDTGYIGILKGSVYDNKTTGGIVHRSPPVKGERNGRLLLCVDKPYC
jgi:Protein of unknown function (DUF1826)